MSPTDVTQTPCVKCGTTPTKAHAYGGTQATVGRVCVKCARELKTAGVTLALDDGSTRNWPTVHE